METYPDSHSNGGLLIRQANAAEAGLVAAITAAAYEKYVPLLGREPQPMTADYRQMIASGPVWLLFVEGQPAGILVLVDEPGQLLIYSVAVHPDYQKQGHGKRLLEWAEWEARSNGCARIRLYTNALMVDNIALYLRLGYEETGREAYLGSTLVHMAKAIVLEGA